MKNAALVAGLLLLSVGLAFSASTPPDVMNYQGVLRDAEDRPLDGTYGMVFRFFSADSGGDAILVDDHGTVGVSEGLFNVGLGSGSVTDGAGPGKYTTLSRVFADYPDLYVEVEVGGETLAPRIRVVSAGYALNTRYVRGMEMVSGGPLDLYVDGIDGNDEQDGLSWDTPKQTIQAAVDAIPALLTGDAEVHVKDGTYNEQVRLLRRNRLQDFYWVKLTAETISDPPSVVIDGSGIPLEPFPSEAGVFVTDAPVEIRGISVINFIEPTDSGACGFKLSNGGPLLLKGCRAADNDIGLQVESGQAFLWDTQLEASHEVGVYLFNHALVSIQAGTGIGDNWNQEGAWAESGSFLMVHDALDLSDPNPCSITNNGLTAEWNSTIDGLNRCIVTNSVCHALGTGECSDSPTP